MGRARHEPGRPFSPVSLVLSLRTMMSAEAAGDLEARIRLDTAGEHFFWIRLARDLKIGRGEIEAPHLVLRGSPSAIAGYVYTGAPLSSIEAEGDLRLKRRLPSLFPLPEKAPLAAA